MFEFWLDDVLVGHSKLERGDAPMGVAFGHFLPTKQFEHFRVNAESLDKESRRWQNLVVKTSNGQIIECNAGAVIIEYGSPNDIIGIEVSCLGIGYPLYEDLFPHHVKAYKEQFEG